MNKKRLLGLKSGGGRAVARIGDMHTCPLSDGLLQKHKGGPIFASADTVLFDGEKVARTGDKAECKGATDTLISGSSSVVIGGRNVARIGDKTAHGGMIVEGSSTIFIGGDTIVSIDAIRDAFQVEERRVGVILKRTTLKENSMVAWLSIKGFFVDKPGLGKLVGITWQAEKRANEAFEMPATGPTLPRPGRTWGTTTHFDMCGGALG